MAGGSRGQRILVVDDVEQMRRLIQRALTAGGYEVDAAATLSQARGMDLARYVALLVDANVGAERGLDLVDELRSKDPAAAARCLVITGGAAGALPEEVSCLSKPFQVGDLLAAVRRLCQPDSVPAPGQGPGAAPKPAAALATAVPTGSAQTPAGESPAWRLLEITRRLRARERRELAAFLHDGPIQELTAATLELQMLRRSPPACPESQLDAVQRLVDVAAGAVRRLLDAQQPFLRPDSRLAVALQQRIGPMLAAPVTVDTGGRPGLAGIDVPLIVDVTELMLLGCAPESPPARAHVAVRAEGKLLQIQLDLACADNDHASGDQAIDARETAAAALAELAAALQANTHSEFRAGLWRARITLPRQPAPVAARNGG